MSEFLGTLWEFIVYLGEMIWTGLTIAASYIAVFFTWVGEGIGGWIGSLHIPMLPTISRVLGVEAVSGTILALFAIYIIVINIISFNMFVSDKKKAESRREMRTSERALLSVCFWGGSLGGFLGMRIARHKTLKKKFTIGVTVMLVIQALLFSMVVGFFGFWIYFK